MRRLVILAVIFLTSLAVPAGADARGIHLRGNLINSSAPVIANTGTCACVWSWNTIALRPGPVTVTTHVQAPATVEANTYQLSVVVLAPNQMDTLKQGSVLCSRASASCGKTVTLHLNIQHAGVYFIQVRGKNAEQLWFSMSVHGNIQALHCNFKKHTC